MDIAVSEKDYLARQFLDWFVNEQLEEVSKMDRCCVWSRRRRAQPVYDRGLSLAPINGVEINSPQKTTLG
jgi:hypothetical protein